jgi:hypothetical protein
MNAPLYYSHHFISTMLLQNVSALKEPFSGSMSDTFPQQDQQNMYQMYNSV